MRPFKYSHFTDAAKAVQSVSANADSKFIAGGTNLLDLMKEGVERPSDLADISRIPLTQIRAITGGASIGALAKNSDTANHPLIRRDFPLLSQAIVAGASAQIRNMATNGGNIMQRTRCPYFYDVSMPCNKRRPNSGCGAIGGINRTHAIFGASDKCIAVNPSDMSVALAALEATVNVSGASGKTRSIAFSDFHLLPGQTPEKDNALAQGELITSIEIKNSALASNSYYLKIRDRSSYAFALVSVAAAFEVKGGIIRQARIVMGGVAPKPWRSVEAEKALTGKSVAKIDLNAVADAAMTSAKTFEHSVYKVELGKRAIVLAIKRALKI